MANQTNPNKMKLQLWVDKSIVAQIDGVAARKGVSRAAVVTEAVKRYMDDGDRPATKADLVSLAAALTKAIENQPMQVQIQTQQDVKKLESGDERKRPWWKFGRG